MAGATKTTLADAIKTTYEPKFRKTFYEGTPTLNLFPRRPNTGGDSINWRVHYAGNTAGGTLSEGGTPDAAGYQSYTTATVAHQMLHTTVQITGHARDAMRNGNFDGAAKEMEGGVSRLQKLVGNACVAAIIAAIDDDTSYAGLVRATYGLAATDVAGGSGALTQAMLSTMYETPKLTPRAVSYIPGDHIILSAPEQATAYTEISTGLIVTGDAEASGANLPYNTSQGDATLDSGLLKHTLQYNKLPWIEAADMTNTYVFLMKRSDMIVEEARPITIDPLGKIDDSDRFLLTWNGGFAYTDPYRASRISALTT